jgi:phage terminase large subunit-like protein
MRNLPRSYQDLIDRVYSPLPRELTTLLSKQNMKSLSLQETTKVIQILNQRALIQDQTQIVTWFQDPTDHPALQNCPLGRKHYPKQMRFFALETTDDEIALFGGNRTGKTHCGCFADVLHLTGLYPDWWPGRRYPHPIDMWVATDTAKNTRDILQEKFCGKPGQEQAYGTGMIPGDLLVRRTVKHGLADAFESVFVRHVSGGLSTLQFKSYDQGREAFQGTRQHRIHLDEEPKLEIYTECLLRLLSTVPGEPNGTLALTETPMLGVSDLMITFMPDLSPEPDSVPAQAWDLGEEEEVIDEQSSDISGHG